MRVEFLSAEGLDPGGDAGALVTHMNRLKSKARSPKSKVAIYGRARHFRLRPALRDYGETSRARCLWYLDERRAEDTARPTNSIHQHQHAHLLRKASLTGEFVCFAEILFLSVFICVHSWLKDFSNA
jgi:hypothetical protein